MAAPRKLPPDYMLAQMVRHGMTHQQIADEVEKIIGEPVSRSSVSAALSRAGISRAYLNYKDVVPWTVRPQHQATYPIKMLRLLGRRRQDFPLTDEQTGRLDSWLQTVEEGNLVVAYAPHTISGTIYVGPDEDADKPDGIPIRPRTIEEWEVDPDV